MRSRMTIAILAVLALPCLLNPPGAEASPLRTNVIHDAAQFCHWLDADDSIEGTLWAAKQVSLAPNADEEYFVGVLQYALLTICPEHSGAVEAAANSLPGKRIYAT